MTNLDLIQLRFANRALLTLGEACQLLGICAATARNQICQKRFPIQVNKVNGRSYVSVVDLANYLDGVSKVCQQATTKAASEPLAVPAVG